MLSVSVIVPAVLPFAIDSNSETLYPPSVTVTAPVCLVIFSSKIVFRSLASPLNATVLSFSVIAPIVPPAIAASSEIL